MAKALWDLLLDVILDTLRVSPFLFLAYLLIEFIEHRASEKMVASLTRLGKMGPLLGAVSGILPHFSVAAANLYTARLISFGALLAVFVSTSEDALALLLSSGSYRTIVLLMLIKCALAIAAGLLADRIVREPVNHPDQELAHRNLHEGCGHDECDHGILRPAILHTLRSLFFVFISIGIINVLFLLIGPDRIGSLLQRGWLFQPLAATLIGLIPGCAPSILLTEFYLSGVLSFGSLLSGLMATTGISFVVLVRSQGTRQKRVLQLLIVLITLSLVSGYVLQFISF